MKEGLIIWSESSTIFYYEGPGSLVDQQSIIRADLRFKIWTQGSRKAIGESTLLDFYFAQNFMLQLSPGRPTRPPVNAKMEGPASLGPAISLDAK